MAFKPKKYRDIFEEMRRRTPADVLNDFEVGSVTRTLYETFSYELALVYEKMNLVYLSAFVDTARGNQLEQVVAILGIKRGLPDFSTGTITFFRDVGKEDIIIPIGTLVATPEDETNAKKVYQTIETKALAQDQTSVDLRVQAVARGEDQDTDPETVSVMPRPIPGIKSVSNNENIRLIGKQRETDEELRERAKNALISSGKASVIAIENALLALQEVIDVKIQEDYRYASGKARFEKTGPPENVVRIPKGTILAYDMTDPKRLFFTREEITLPSGITEANVNIQAKFQGLAGEVSDPAPGNWTIQDATLSDLTASVTDPVTLGEFGVISVYVDAPDFTNDRAVIQEAIDGVRAAGILALLDEVQRIKIGAILRIETNPNLNLTLEERLAFEDNVATEILRYLKGIKMGSPLLFSRLTKEIMSIENVDNLVDYQFSFSKEDRPVKMIRFEDRINRIEIEPFERISPDYVRVASEEKSLKVNIEFQSGFSDLGSKMSDIKIALEGFFNSLKPGENVSRDDLRLLIKNAIDPAAADDILEEEFFKIKPVAWRPRSGLILEAGTSGESVAVSMVESATLGDIFAYHSFLEINGAFKPVLPLTLTNKEKEAVFLDIKNAIKQYLDELGSEEDIIMEDIVAVATAVDRVLAVEYDEEDFEVLIDDEVDQSRLSDGKVHVEPLEKTRLKHLCVTDGVELVEVNLASLKADLLVLEMPPNDDLKNELKTRIRDAFNSFIPLPETGQDLNYTSLQGALVNLVPGASYVITEFNLSATSVCDDRLQTTGLATAGKNIKVRSPEVLKINTITSENVNVTVVQSA